MRAISRLTLQRMSGWKASDPEITWFWRALRSFSQEERARFLMFVASSSRVPLGGFTQLQGASGIQPFQIQQVSSPGSARSSTHSLIAVQQRRQLAASQHLLQSSSTAKVRVLREPEGAIVVCND